MSIGSITLNSSLKEREHQLIARWLINLRSVAPQDWPNTLKAFDRLKESRIEWEGQRLTFAEFYDQWVEERYATPFIEGLMELTALETEGHRVLAVYAQRLGQDLAKLLADRPQVLSERMLIAHCLYWWNAFGKGYLFELMVFADLTAEGIPFHAHDLRRREERYSPEDLVITSLRSVQSLLRSIGVERSEIPQSGALQWHGDVKTSTYFLYVVRSFPLRHDFYITRLFVTETNVWRWAVLLTPIMWKALDGDTQPATLEEAGRLLPAVLEVQTRGGTLMVVDYALWKTKVKAQQHRKEENPNGKDVG